jgi:GT2 family glycosyltransferase
MFILPSASLISRAAFDHAGGYDERLSGYEDDDLFLRLFRLGYTNIYINQPLSQWRISGKSCSHSPRMAKSRAIYVMKLLETYPDDPLLNRSYRDVIVLRFMKHLLWDYRRLVGIGDAEQARQAAADVARLSHYANGSRRCLFGLLSVVLRQPRLARIFFSLWPLFRRTVFRWL